MTKKSSSLFFKIMNCALTALVLSTMVFVFSQANFLTINQAQAAGWWDKAKEGGLGEVGKAYSQTGAAAEPRDIRLMAASMIRVVLELLGIIALVIIIFAGFRWMTAGGDEEKVTTSKKQLVNGLIGLIIILVAFSIATFVFYQLQYITTGIQPITWSW